MPLAKITVHELPFTKIVVVCITFATVNVGGCEWPLPVFLYVDSGKQTVIYRISHNYNEKYKILLTISL